MRFKGFTLIELIIVVAILALLAAALFVAIDPARRMSNTQDTRRWSDVSSILNAILTYSAENSALPTSVNSMANGEYYMIMTSGDATSRTEDPGMFTCTNLAGSSSASTTLNTMILKPDLVPGYLATIPVDPSQSAASTGTTRYYIMKNSSGRVFVGACDKSTYQTGQIQVAR